jgi:hypothetical protein
METHRNIQFFMLGLLSGPMLLIAAQALGNSR